MKQQDIDFCKQHIINFESVKLGFTRNIPFDVLGEYERMYREYLDRQFSLTYWCGECVFDMLNRLIVLFEQSNVQSEPISEQPIIENQEVSLQKKKRGRPKK
jgi:hypothetical protein